MPQSIICEVDYSLIYSFFFQCLWYLFIISFSRITDFTQPVGLLLMYHQDAYMNGLSTA